MYRFIFDKDGNKRCFDDKGKLYRNEFSPVIDEFGNKYWFNNKGLIHRDNDLPAVEYFIENKEWRFNGKLHRINGPAATCFNGYVEYWLENKRYTKEEWEVEKLKYLNKSCTCGACKTSSPNLHSSWCDIK